MATREKRVGVRTGGVREGRGNRQRRNGVKSWNGGEMGGVDEDMVR